MAEPSVDFANCVQNLEHSAAWMRLFSSSLLQLSVVGMGWNQYKTLEYWNVQIMCFRNYVVRDCQEPPYQYSTSFQTCSDEDSPCALPFHPAPHRVLKARYEQGRDPQGALVKNPLNQNLQGCSQGIRHFNKLLTMHIFDKGLAIQNISRMPTNQGQEI